MENIDLGLARNQRVLSLPFGAKSTYSNLSVSHSSISTPTRMMVIFGQFIKKYRLGLALALAMAIVIAAAWAVFSIVNSQPSTTKVTLTQIPLNQHYQLAAHDVNGVTLNKVMDMAFIDAKKTNVVLIQGKRAQAINGKIFLLLDFNIVNPDKTVYYANTSDLFRLSGSGSDKSAPAVHQGILEIRPISTKASTIGFLVGQDQKNFTLEVGEIDGHKQQISISFP